MEVVSCLGPWGGLPQGTLQQANDRLLRGRAQAKQPLHVGVHPRFLEAEGLHLIKDRRSANGCSSKTVIDAVEIDNSDITQEEQFRMALAVVERVLGKEVAGR